MSDRTVVLELGGEHAKLARDIVAGGVFVPGYTLAINEDCELILRGNGAQLHLNARVVWSSGAGIGLQLENCDAEMKQRIVALAAPLGAPAPSIAAPAPRISRAPSPAPASTIASHDPIGTTDSGDGDRDARRTDATITSPANDSSADDHTGDTSDADATSDSKTSDPMTVGDGATDEIDSDAKKPGSGMHERLRGLTLAQQLKIAHHGEVSERILLERMYSKNVWEALLRNSRLTGPEVSRIARMGALPRPLMEIILNNGGWLQIPEVRRALLSNPRLGTDQIMRILRLLPKHEIKMAAMQTVYPLGVRDAAKKLIKEAGGG